MRPKEETEIGRMQFLKFRKYKDGKLKNKNLWGFLWSAELWRVERAASIISFPLQLLPGEGLSLPVGSRAGLYSAPDSSLTWTDPCVEPGVELSTAGSNLRGLPPRAAVSEVAQRPGFDLWVRKIPWRRKWQSTPVLLPGKSHGQRSLVGYSPWGLKESDTTVQPHFSTILRWLHPIPLTFQYAIHVTFPNFGE